MRRSLATLLFGFAAIVGSLALSGFWLQYTAFSPDNTRDAASAVLGDNDIRNDLAGRIADATVAQLPQFTAIDLRNIVLQTAATDQGKEILAGLLQDAHAHLIGQRSEPVEVSSELFVEVLRDERAMVVPALQLDIPEIGALSVIDQVLTWLVPIAAGLTVLFIVLGFAAHPEKAELLQSLAILFLAMALLLVIVGFVVPAFVVPLFSDNVWINAVPQLARESLSLLVALTLLLGVAGVGCLLGGLSSRRRDRWSQPIRRTNYREERRWS